MRDVTITPSTSSYQFNANVYPDTGGTATIIAANVAERQRMSILPHTRQLHRAGGRLWNISGLTILDVDYQGRSARVKALISPSMKDNIFFDWTTLRSLLSGSIYDGKTPTPNELAQRSHVMDHHSHSGLTPLYTATPIPVLDARKLFLHVNALVDFSVSFECSQALNRNYKKFLMVLTHSLLSSTRTGYDAANNTLPFVVDTVMDISLSQE